MKASGFLEKLQSGDAVMARPVMMKNNVSALASIATRHVATARVHIERIINRYSTYM